MFEIQPFKGVNQENCCKTERDVLPGFTEDDGDGCEDDPDRSEPGCSCRKGWVIQDHIEMVQQHQACDYGVDDINGDWPGFLGHDVFVQPCPELFERGAEEAEQGGAAEQDEHDRKVDQVLRYETGGIRSQIT